MFNPYSYHVQKASYTLKSDVEHITGNINKYKGSLKLHTYIISQINQLRQH